MWYELLINGYRWFSNTTEYTPKFKISETVGGELTEGDYTHSERQQVCEQMYYYRELGYNPKLKHLGRSGVHAIVLNNTTI